MATGARPFYNGGRVILWVHGWGASPRFWDGTVRSLGGTAVDLLGAGKTVEQLADFVAGQSPEVLVGHSMGGMICARVASRRPSWLRKLVLVSAPICGRRALFWKSYALMAPGMRWLAYAMLKGGPTRRLMTRDFTYVAPLPPELLDVTGRDAYGPLVSTALSVRDTDLTDALGQIAAPTLIVAGDHDAMVRADQFELARARIPGARLDVIPECGHCPMIERPEAFERSVSEFLKRV
jgi:3-oxoadipate enol-lactonase